MCFFQVPPCDLGQSQYNLRIFYSNLRISLVSFITKCAFLRFFVGLWTISRLWKISGLWKMWLLLLPWLILVICFMLQNSLINKVYNLCTFYTSQACLIRENDKNGNFRHFPQLDRLEGYKNVRDNIVRNKAIFEILWIFTFLRYLRLGPRNCKIREGSYLWVLRSLCLIPMSLVKNAVFTIF